MLHYHLQVDNLSCHMEVSLRSYGLVKKLHWCCSKMKDYAAFFLVCMVDMDSANLMMPLLLIRALLVMSGDVEINPGPGKRGQYKSTL